MILEEIFRVPEVETKKITREQALLKIEELENYNKLCRFGRAHDETGDPIPAKYRGFNRYRIRDSLAHDQLYGDVNELVVYDLDPEVGVEGYLISRYRIVSDDGTKPMQTLQQIERHQKVARMTAEMEERQVKKDPRLTVSHQNVKLPTLYEPEEGRRLLDDMETVEAQ